MARLLETFSIGENELEQQVIETPWYSSGLKFKCTGCGQCCTGSPGYVFLSFRDTERLAAHFSMSTADFSKTYTYKVDDRTSLIDRSHSEDCIFLKDNKCSVYEARPVQCRTFPWWLQFLRDAATWENAASRCEGINHPDAPVISSLLIQEQCLTYLDNLLEQNFSF